MIRNKTGVHWYSLSGVQCAWMHCGNARIRSYTSEVSASSTFQTPKHPLIFELPTVLLSFQFSNCALYCHVQALQFALQALSELNLMISKVKYSRLGSDDDSHTFSLVGNSENLELTAFRGINLKDRCFSARGATLSSRHCLGCSQDRA